MNFQGCEGQKQHGGEKESKGDWGSLRLWEDRHNRFK